MKRVFILFLLIGTLSAQTLKLNNNTATVDASGNILSGSNYTLEGYATGKSVLRITGFQIQPGATPNTNINITQLTEAGASYNKPTFTNATNMPKNSSAGSFSFTSDGTTIILNLSETVIGILGVTIITHDINSSSTSQSYYVYADIGTGKMQFKIRKRGSAADVDWSTIIDAGDDCSFVVAYITST